MSDSISEFLWLDPVELHLVGHAANDYEALVAKEAAGKKGGKKMKKRELESLIKRVEALIEPQHPNFPARVPVSGVSVAGAGSTMSGGDVELRAILAGLDANIASKEVALARATDYNRSVAKRELRDARAHSAKLKFMLAEHLRMRDPNMVARRLNGSGTPLLFNSHALGEDSDLKAI